MAAVRVLWARGAGRPTGRGQRVPSLGPHREVMTVTFFAWLAIAARLALAGVRLARRHPATVPARPSAPARSAGRGSCGDDDDWRPRVSSGCGR